MADNELPDFDGQDVVASSVRITKAGDGLSEALKIRPVAMSVGDLVYYVLRGVVEQVNHKPVDHSDLEAGLVRVHTVAAVGITTIDRANAERFLNKAAEELADARAKAAGGAGLTLLDGEG